MLYCSITPGLKVRSPNAKVLFEVTGIAKHAQACMVEMVCYTNLEPTPDAPIGTPWVLEKSLFRKLMVEA